MPRAKTITAPVPAAISIEKAESDKPFLVQEKDAEGNPSVAIKGQNQEGEDILILFEDDTCPQIFNIDAGDADDLVFLRYLEDGENLTITA